MVKKNKKKGFLSDKVFDIANVCIMIILFFVFTYPLYYVLISSFSSPAAVWSGNVTLWPKDFTLIGYKERTAVLLYRGRHHAQCIYDSAVRLSFVSKRLAPQKLFPENVPVHHVL